MANSNSKKELLEIEAIQNRILKLNELEKKYAQEKNSYQKRRLKEVQTEKSQLENIVTLRKEENKELLSLSKQYNRLSADTKAALGATKGQLSTYQSLNVVIAKQVALTKLNPDDSDEQARLDVLQDISTEALSQAKATLKAEETLKGITSYKARLKELEENAVGLSEDALALAKEQLKNTELNRLKEERLNQLIDERKGLMDSLPGPIQDMVGAAKKFGSALKNGALPMVLLASLAVAALSSFTKLDESAKEFRQTTGLTNTQMEGIKSDANEIAGQFSHLGVEAKNVFDTVAALKSEFSDIADFSKETTAALTVLSTNFGVSAENAAKVQGVLEQVSGLSSETAASVQMQVAKMAQLAGVAPAKVMADIAESAEIASTLFKGDVNALAASAIEARRLGTNLKSVAATAEKLLDFEGGIEEELTAATYVGGQFNLSRARALAFEGKIVEAQKETLAQIQRSGDFRKKDYFTQQQLAKAAGMSVEEINKQLDAQDKLNSLSEEQKKLAEDAISKGLDITNIDKEQLATQVAAFSKQQEQQATLEKLQNTFMGIASTVGSVLTPLLEGLGAILQFVLTPVTAIVQGMAQFINYIKESAPLLSAVLGIVTAIAVQKGLSFYYTNQEMLLEGIKNTYKTVALGIETAINAIKKRGLLMTIADAAMSAYKSIAAIPFIGWALGIGAAAAALAYGYSLMGKAGDMMSPADGKTQVSTKEGGLFELSPNDDLIAAPGAADALTKGGGDNGGVNLSALAAPLQAVVTEIKALRADLSAGKIAVYMDAQKVTNGVSKTVDQSTRNSYNLGTV